MAGKEKEPGDERLMAHSYDGIQEYDNPLPGWWVWLFVLSVLFAPPYILHWHFGQGPSLDEALQAEKEAYAAQMLATYGELSADRETIFNFMDDDTAMLAMAGLFRGRCAQCHLADGSGQVGPNLTDNSWINVTRVTDISEIIRSGLPTKGMPAWGDRLSETQIALLSSYVARLSRNPVGGKEAQGDVLPDWRAIPGDTETELVNAETAAAEPGPRG